jgi:MFS family permease
MCLWLAQVFSQLADRVIFVVFVALIVHHYGANESYNSYLYIAFTIPAILLTAIAGVFVDRWPRKLTLILTNVLRAALMLLLPFAVQGSLLQLYTLAFLLSAVTQFFVPAEAATIPAIVSTNQLMTANSLFTTTMMASLIVGFALGDPLISAFGLAQIHWVIGALFAASALLLLGLKLPQTVALKNKSDELPCNTTIQNSFVSFYGDIKEGFAFIKESAPVWQAMAKLALLFSVLVAMCILSISYAKHYLFSNPEIAARKFAYIVAISGIGMAIGAALVGKPLRRVARPVLVYSGLLLVGLGLSALACVAWVLPHLETMALFLPAWQLGSLYVDALPLTQRMVYTYSSVILLGLGAAFVSIPLQALLHERIPEDKRGKVLGLQFTLLSTSSTLPVLIVGLATEYIGVLTLFWLMASPFLIWGFLGLKHVWECRRGTAVSEW